MKEYHVLHDTIIRGRFMVAGKTMMLTPDKAKAYVDHGLVIDVETLAAAEAAKAKAENKATKAGKTATPAKDA